jgi:site-specific recombinase XerD
VNVVEPPAAITFEQIVNEWLADRALELRESSMYDYRSVARGPVKHFGAATGAESIDTDAIDTFRDALAADGRSGRTINKRLAALHAIYKLARRRHHLPENPVTLARRSKQRRRKLEQWLLPDEVLRLASGRRAVPGCCMDGSAVRRTQGAALGRHRLDRRVHPRQPQPPA